MKKIAVLGCPGAGKTTFSRKLHALTELPLHHLDLIWHKPDRTNIPREEFDRILQEIIREENWIIDGNYSRTVETRIAACDTVFLFDLPTEECLQGAISRIGKERPDMPWTEKELDPQFKQWIIDFSDKELPKTYELLRKYEDGKNVVIFKSRKEADQYIENLKNQKEKLK